jgi:hypothetical protein
MSENPDATVLFNGWWPEWAMEWYPGIIRGALIPSKHLIVKHLESHPAREMGADLPKLLSEIDENIRGIEEMMDAIRKPVYTGPPVDELFGQADYEREVEADELS